MDCAPHLSYMQQQGPFKKAGADELAKRRIVKARRGGTGMIQRLHLIPYVLCTTILQRAGNRRVADWIPPTQCACCAAVLAWLLIRRLAMHPTQPERPKLQCQTKLWQLLRQQLSVFLGQSLSSRRRLPRMTHPRMTRPRIRMPPIQQR